jgi:hypothetical protein
VSLHEVQPAPRRKLKKQRTEPSHDDKSQIQQRDDILGFDPSSSSDSDSESESAEIAKNIADSTSRNEINQVNDIKNNKNDISCTEEPTPSVVDGDSQRVKSNCNRDDDEQLAETKTVVDSFKERVF